MTQKDKSLNCLNCRIGDFKRNLCDCHDGFCAKYKGIGTEKDFFKAIEALQPDRPHGEWIRISNDWIDGTCGTRYFPIRCSVCGYATYDDDATNFCPTCGADMRKENK